jgi:hypothetical protein
LIKVRIRIRVRNSEVRKPDPGGELPTAYQQYKAMNGQPVDLVMIFFFGWEGGILPGVHLRHAAAHHGGLLEPLLQLLLPQLLLDVQAEGHRTLRLLHTDKSLSLQLKLATL